MTVLTKPSVQLKMASSSKLPLVLESVENGNPVEEERSENTVVYPSYFKPTSLYWLTMMLLLVSTTGLLCGVMLYRHWNDHQTLKRFCYIPAEPEEPTSGRVPPLRWSEEPGDAAGAALREQLDIAAQLETVRVLAPRDLRASFLHDFDANITGIITTDRCFVMPLDPEQVLPPATLMSSILSGEQLDLTRSRTTLRAEFPPDADWLGASLALDTQCGGKNTYLLVRDIEIIRKRSVDGAEPEPDFRHFSGRHIAEIEIHNMADLIAYEKKNK